MADERDAGADLERDLAAIAAATADLDVDPRLGDAVARGIAGGDASLARLAEATSALEPTEDFTAAVLAAVSVAPRATSLDAVARTGPVAVVVAAVAAAAALLFSFETQRDVDATIVTSVLSVEVGE